MKNKMMTIVIVVLVTVLLLGVVGFVVITKLGGNDNETAKVTEPSIEEITLASVDVPELTTNLMDGNFIRLSLKIQTNSEEAAAELLMREFQTKNIVIQTLSEMAAEDLEGKTGKIDFQNTIKVQLNELMQTGEVQKVYITSYMIP
ncbi:MAG: flagellar basal body-associated protein FliL [Caryophanon sp.]|uniref:Flagellar protein FliL n=1 Tax=Caryophanon latum TaxID=33977 RepID=A0A1C0YAV4_9BACL|nr:flagellar basal body-associated protein FliL [Caryophanon latum]MEE1132476.1 flagellar basal body-associated protein FliL [Caryophanon sp.]OCS84263.1 flagellar basal body-associated protein FliL [Caryophanon latum]